MPSKVVAVGGKGRIGERYSIHWHVPVDDDHHIRFDFIFDRARPPARERYEQDLVAGLIENRHRRNNRSRYLQDRELVKTTTLSGMRDYNAAQDAFATETPGPIRDRSREHLVTSDTHIIAARRRLLAAFASVQAGTTCRISWSSPS